MAAYQIRQGKPQVGYYGTGPGPQDYQAMAEYLELKKLRKNIRKQIGWVITMAYDWATIKREFIRGYDDEKGKRVPKPTFATILGVTKLSSSTTETA